MRLNVLRSLHNLSDFVTLDQVSEALLPSLDELSSDKLWRVRHQLVALTPTLGQHLGMVFFQRDLLGRTLHWLTDSAAIIRKTAAESLCEVAVAFGREWTKDHVLGRVRCCPVLTAKGHDHKQPIRTLFDQSVDRCSQPSPSGAAARRYTQRLERTLWQHPHAQLSIALPAVLVKLPDLCCNTRAAVYSPTGRAGRRPW